MLGETLRSRPIADRAAVVLAGGDAASSCAGRARSARQQSSASTVVMRRRTPRIYRTCRGPLPTMNPLVMCSRSLSSWPAAGAGPHGRHPLVGVHRRGVRSERTMCGSPSDRTIVRKSAGWWTRRADCRDARRGAPLRASSLGRRPRWGAGCVALRCSCGVEWPQTQDRGRLFGGGEKPARRATEHCRTPPGAISYPHHSPVRYTPKTDRMRSPKQLFRTLLARDRIVLLVILFVSIVCCAVVAADLQAAILTAVRSYVGGEGLWSKAQKASVYHLTRYATSHREEDFELYRRAIDVPLGDRQARLWLGKPGPDLEVVREGFLRGSIHPDDIPGMASLFRNFRRVSYMARAIAIWAEGDRLIRELQRLAGELHAEVSSGHPESERVKVILEEIARVDAELTPLEDAFSKDLGEGARWAHAWMTRAIYTASLLL